MNRDYLTNLIQCILFLSPSPVKREDLILHFHIDKDILDQCVTRLKDNCNGTGLEFIETATGMELATRREFIEDLKFFFANIEKMRISRAALETMAIVAYRQPITRAEIEAIRGVNSQGVLSSLMDKGLLRISGKSDAAGRPFIFSTSDEFLRFIGASSLEDLPPLDSLQKNV